MKFENPVIRGYYPDPSVCRVGDRYYLVCSSFQYFPGVPLFESRDLINWEQIGYCLTRESQLPLDKTASSCGVFAPTIRYNDGVFYMTTTNVGGGGNFYVFTHDIYGEWSEPVFIEQGGIDPSLYFEDGRAFFMSNGYDGDGNSAIIQCEIDIKTGKKLSEGKALWGGTGGRYLESPHLYKIGGYYYLLVAEGGTEYGHMVTYARSKDMWDPYEPYAKNPVLTNRNLGGYEIQGVGHSDLTDDPNGNYWLFHLGFRQIDQWLPFHHLGREVFLMPVDFDDGWFTVGDGTTAKTVETDRIADNTVQQFKDEYTLQNIKKHDLRFLRKFEPEHYVFGEDRLKIKSSGDALNDAASPAFVSLHQKEFNMDFSATVEVNDGEAGLCVYMDEEHHYDLSIAREGEACRVRLMLNIGGIRHEQASVAATANKASLKIISNPFCYEFFCTLEGEQISLGSARTRYLSSEVACGFTGVVVGPYSQNGQGGGFNEFSELVIRYSR